MNSLVHLFLLFLLSAGSSAFSQSLISKNAAVDSAYKNNPGILSSLKEIERQKAIRKGSGGFDKTDLWIEAPTAVQFAVGVQQTFNFPSYYFNEVKFQKENVKLAERQLTINKNSLGRNVELLYLDIQFLKEKQSQLRYQDSIYAKLYKATEKRYSVGEVELLEKILEETKYSEINNLLLQNTKEVESAQGQLKLITGISMDSFAVEKFSKLERPAVSRSDTTFLSGNPIVGYYNQNRMVSQRLLKVQWSSFMPGIFLGYLNQGFSNSDIRYRFRVGVTLPLWFPTYTSRIKSARIGIDIAEYQYKLAVTSAKVDFYKAYTDLEKSRLNLQYYEEKALKQADEIIRTSTKLYDLGEISYFIHLNGLGQALEIKLRYLNALKEYNQAIIQLNYLRVE